MKTVAVVLGTLFGVFVFVGVIALIFWLLLPMAFPALTWTYWNALALSALFFLIGLPWLVKD